MLKAFSSQLMEATLDNLPFQGVIPTWLKGSFVNNGPAQFEVGDTHFTHWFDGFAMLKKFHFDNGKVNFQNRFLQSNQYVKSNELKALSQDEFGTYVNGSWLGNVFHNLKSKNAIDDYDNCNVNTARIGDNYIAMTESNHILEFDLNDLSTVGPFRFDDTLNAQISLAHPQLDIQTNEVINVCIEIGKTCQYHVYKVKPGRTMRELIQTVHCDYLFYMHSFSITPNYVILFKTPFQLNKWKLMLRTTISRAFEYNEGLPSYFVLINRHTGKITEIETNPYVCLHSINAFEKGNELIIDLTCYDKGNPYDLLYLDNVTRNPPTFADAFAKRYILNVDTKQCKMEPFNQYSVEFPRINYTLKNGLDYQYAYMTLLTTPDDLYLNAIQKLNVQTGDIKIWKKDSYYCEEPVFIPKENSTVEDDGILMFIAHQGREDKSSLMILDANSMHQMAEITLPFHMPMGIHSNFYQD